MMNLEKTTIPGIYKQALKSGDISWYGKFRHPVNGKSVRKKLGSKIKDKIKNEKIALVALQEYLEFLRNYNNDNLQVPLEYQNYLTLQQLAENYFVNRQKKKKRLLREQYTELTDEEFENYSVVKTKLTNLKKEINRFDANVACFQIAKINVNQITKQHINEYIEIDLASKNLSQKTKFNVVALIKTIFNYAIKNDMISIKNPFANIQFKNPKRQRERVLTEEEIKLLLQECKKEKENPNIYLSVYLAVLTAGRASTILNIRKKDINTKTGFISLYNFKANKQYQLRISENAAKWLDNKVLPHYTSDDFIIRAVKEGNRKTLPQPLRSIPRAVYKIMDKLFNKGLDKQNNKDRDKVANFHTIRRSLATNLAKNGTPLIDIMMFLNHANVEQTMRYLNMDSNELHSNVNILMDTIFKDFKKTINIP